MSYKERMGKESLFRNVALVLLSFLFVIFGSAMAAAATEKCEIPSADGKPTSTECAPGFAPGLEQNESVELRGQLMQVECDSKLPGRYWGQVKVEKWLKGKGAAKLEVYYTAPLKAGKGLNADFTLVYQHDKWFIKSIANRTTSEAQIPNCEK